MKKSKKEKTGKNKARHPMYIALWTALWQDCESSLGRNRESRVMQVVLCVYATGVRFCIYWACVLKMVSAEGRGCSKWRQEFCKKIPL